MNREEIQKIKIYGSLGMSILIMLTFTLIRDNWGDLMSERHDFFSWTGHQFVKPVGVKGEPGYWDGKLYLSSYVNDLCEYFAGCFVLYAGFVASKLRIFFALMWLELVHALDYAIHFGMPYGTIHDWPVGYVHVEVFLFSIFAVVYAKRS